MTTRHLTTKDRAAKEQDMVQQWQQPPQEGEYAKEGDTVILGDDEEPWTLISIYTRAQGIEDGYLLDVSETAREAGISYPVAVTRQLWGDIIEPDERARKFGQSEAGRLWDVLWMFRMAAKFGTGSTLHYRLSVIMKERQRRTITLKAICGPGDHGEPVITIMLPEED